MTYSTIFGAWAGAAVGPAAPAAAAKASMRIGGLLQDSPTEDDARGGRFAERHEVSGEPVLQALAAHLVRPYGFSSPESWRRAARAPGRRCTSRRRGRRAGRFPPP